MNDEAFAKVPKSDLDGLQKDKAKLTSTLAHPVFAGQVLAKDIRSGKVKTVQGGELAILSVCGVGVDAAKVTAPDVMADNGVMHVIDTVLIPK